MSDNGIRAITLNCEHLPEKECQTTACPDCTGQSGLGTSGVWIPAPLAAEFAEIVKELLGILKQLYKAWKHLLRDETWKIAAKNIDKSLAICDEIIALTEGKVPCE